MIYKNIYQSKWILIIIVTIFISCGNEIDKKETIAEYKINGESVFKEKHNIYDVYSMESLILIKNIPEKDAPVFSVYKESKSEFKHVIDFGKTGSGPNEFENGVYYTHQFENENNQLKFWVYEMNRNKYSLINMTQSILLKKTVVDRVIRIKPGVSLKEVFYINEETIVGNTDNLALKMDRLRFYNPVLDSVTKKIGLITKIENLKKNDMNYTQQSYNPIFLNTLRYHSGKEKLVSAMVSIDKIDVFGVNGTYESSIDNREKTSKSIDDYTKKTKIHFADIELTDNYVYALYSGESATDYYENMLPTKIKIYDWNYKLKAVIPIDESLNFISVNEKEGYIIGVSITQEKVMKYNIKEFLNEK